MSAACFIVLNDDDPGFDAFVNGKALAQEAENINDIAMKIGLLPFEHYLSQDLSEFGVPETEPLWFDAGEGIKWAGKLKDYIMANPDSVLDATAVVEELDEYLRVYGEARTRGLQWHFELDY